VSARSRPLRAVTARRSRSRDAAALGTPLVIVPPALLAVLFLLLPTLALLIRTPWGSIGEIYRDQGVWTALRLSATSSLEATAASLVFGVPLAWMLARFRMPGMGIIRAIVTIPLVLPPVIGGVALFAAFGRNGILGRPIHTVLGMDIPFTYPAIVIAQTFVSMPFLVVTVEGAFRIADRGIEEAAATLGASRTRIFTRITLPLVFPAIVAGSVLCWARALGEFGATLLFGGNLPGVTQTLPTLVLKIFQTDPSAAPALALPLMIVAIVVLGALRDKWLRPAASA
jgi:molybdate transport system permease protein